MMERLNELCEVADKLVQAGLVRGSGDCPESTCIHQLQT